MAGDASLDLPCATTLAVTPVVRGPDCIADAELAAASAGELPAERLEALRAHAETCRACADVIATSRDAGRYEIGRVLGAGAMGIVYAAWDPQLRRRVALKIVRPEGADAAARERMLGEARALARVNHPNVVVVYDVDEHRDTLCIATELVDGETLATWQRGRTVEQLVDAWVQAARGLAAAHAAGVVHRDVKPANVLIGRDGRVRVGDFGIARLGDDASPVEGVPGTPAYMAPEQARGEIDARSDQYAVCVALGEAITGARPAANATNLVRDRPALDAALTRGLAEDPAARFPSIEELANALAAAIAPPPRRHRTRVIAATAGAVAVATAAIVWFAWPRTQACTVPQLPSALWSPARRADVAKHVPASVLPRIDRWLAAWSDARSDVCAVERDDPELRARRQRCEVDELTQLDRRLATWQAGDTVPAMIAHDTLEELPGPSRCSHAAQLHIPDPTAAQWIRITAVRLAVQRANDGECNCAVRLTALAADAKAIGYPPLVLEVAKAIVAVDRIAAVAPLRDAIAVADAAGAELLGIEARIELLRVSDDHPPADVGELVETARSLIGKLGGDAELEAAVEQFVVLIEISRGNQAAQLAALQRARRAAQLAWGDASAHEVRALLGIYVASNDQKARAAARDAAIAMNERGGLGFPVKSAAEMGNDPDGFVAQAEELVAVAKHESPDSADLAAAELVLAKAYYLANRLEVAVPAFREAIALAETRSVHDENLTSSYYMFARTLNDLDRHAEALDPAQKAIGLATQLGVDASVGEALVERARARLPADRRAARADLEQAAIALERGHADTAKRAYAAFLLARVTYPDDRRAAIALATSAKNNLERLIEAMAGDPSVTRKRATRQSQLDEVVAWLAKPK